MRAFRLPLLVLWVWACTTEKVNPVENDPRPLKNEVPYTTETIELEGLSGPVDVVRDQWGTIHIYASNVADAMIVQGYQVGRDRTVQLELIRRFSEGTTAEVFGDASPSLIDSDIAQRTIGLTRTAKKTFDGLPMESEERKWLDSFSSGVSQLYAKIVAGEIELPRTIVGFQRKFLTPWTGVDSLAIARYQAQNLSFDADEDIDRTDRLKAYKTIFSPTDPNADRKARSGAYLDLMRFEPLDHTTTLSGFPNDLSHTQGLDLSPHPVSTFLADRDAIARTKAWMRAAKTGEAFFGDKSARGSNNWMVGPSKSATGHAILANDPHLSLSSPSVFWMVHLDVHAPAGKDMANDLNVAGLSFPGIPGIILGFNDKVAWGATTADYDVTDVYEETVTQNGNAVSFKGADVPIQHIQEQILVANGPPINFDLSYVPHHGPIIPDIDANHIPSTPKGPKVLSYRWTGLEPTKEISFVRKMMYAKNVEDVRVAVRDFGVGAQNWISADVDGNIFYSTQSLVPKRDPKCFQWDAKTYTGTLPLFVLPGDGTCEWNGFIEEGYLPHVKNPPEGLLATANADQVGTTLDNDPSNDKLPNGDNGFLGTYSDGFRVGRIYERLRTAKGPITPEEMASIQADVKSPYGAKLAPVLVAMIDHAEEEKKTPGTHPELAALVNSPRYKNVAELRDWLVKWGTDSNYFAESGIDPDNNKPVADPKLAAASQATLLFNAWMIRMAHVTLADEFSVLGIGGTTLPGLVRILTTPPQMLATYDMASGQSILFDDISTQNVKETRDERGITALLDAMDMLESRLGADRNLWRWGTLHTLRFTALVSFWSALSIPAPADPVFGAGFPRHGDISCVDVANFGQAPGNNYSMMSFSYGSGPTQRFVIDMDPKGPIAKNALPGGEVWDTASPHFRDDAERWRRNQTRPVLISRSEVIKEAVDHKDTDERITYVPKKK